MIEKMDLEMIAKIEKIWNISGVKFYDENHCECYYYTTINERGYERTSQWNLDGTLEAADPAHNLSFELNSKL